MISRLSTVRSAFFSVTLLSGLALLCTGSRFAAAHSGDMDMSGMDMGNQATEHQGHTTATAFGEPYQGDKVTRTVAITVGDTSFTPDHLQVKKGETVRFVVTNTSSIDHDFTLGDTATQTAHRKEMMDAMAAGHEPHQHNGGNAITVKPGTTLKLGWRFTKAGTFEYDCNIPGHFESGMHGNVVVTP